MSESLGQSIRDKVLAAVRGGQVKMRPRWHFFLRAALAVAGVIIIFLSLLSIVSFIIFALQQSGVWFLPIFGLRGLRAFLVSLPWLLVAVSVVFIIILEVLVERYSFAYLRPLLYSVLGIVIFVILGGFMVARTSLHHGLFRQAEGNRLPFAGPMYREFGAPRFRNIHFGIVTEVANGSFHIRTRRGETINIIVTPETRFPLGVGIAEGDLVVVFGERDDDTVRAFGVRKVDDKFEENSRERGGLRRYHLPPYPALR